MTYPDDWTVFGTDSSQLIDSPVESGTGALQIGGLGGANTAIVPTSSVDDSPIEAQTIGYYNWGNSNGDDPTAPTWFFRVQDINNYYCILGESQSDRVRWFLHRVENGSGDGPTEHVNFQDYDVGNNWNQITESGVSPSSGYVKVRCSCWEEGGDLRFRIEEDFDEDGSYNQLANDFVDTNPVHSGGGGVGLGRMSARGGGNARWDDVEWFY